jgi:hypothetical protein
MKMDGPYPKNEGGSYAMNRKGYRDAAKKKAERFAYQDPKIKFDASDYQVPDDLNAEVKTGMRPISKRQFKRGGKIEGQKAHHHAVRAKRKDGGMTKAVEDGLMNADAKKANELRDGIKHIGGMKTGGRAKRAGGGPAADPVAVAQGTMSGGLPTSELPASTRLGFNPAHSIANTMGMGAIGIKRGGKASRDMGGKVDKIHDGLPRKVPDGRIARKDGGSTKSKGKTNINIVIAQPKDDKQQPNGMPTPPQAPPRPPMVPPPGGMPAAGPMAGGQMPPQLGPMAGGAMPQMPPGVVPPR